MGCSIMDNAYLALPNFYCLQRVGTGDGPTYSMRYVAISGGVVAVVVCEVNLRERASSKLVSCI